MNVRGKLSHPPARLSISQRYRNSFNDYPTSGSIISFHYEAAGGALGESEGLERPKGFPGVEREDRRYENE